MSKKREFKIIGHRGAAGLVFENTLQSIAKAIALKVDCVEVDVWKTTDDEVIVFHDAYLDRLTSRTGFVSNMSYKEIQNIVLKNNEKIPTLNDVVKLIRGKNILLLVEAKSENAVMPALEILKKDLQPSEYIIGSFFHQCIKDLKEEDPATQTSIMFESVPVALDEYLNTVNPDFVTVSIETFNDHLVDVIKSQNRKLIFYTVNTIPEIELALKASPYAIVTNFPDLFTDDL